MNGRGAYAMVGVGFLLLSCGTWFLLSHRPTLDTESADPQVALSLGSKTIVAEIVDTPTRREIGLSGRLSLPDGEGMLFVFPESDRYGFWMPDMHFAIDIMWLDADWHVVYIQENATPESYPAVFTPDTPARYVLEVPSGFAKQYGVEKGSQVRILDTMQ